MPKKLVVLFLACLVAVVAAIALPAKASPLDCDQLPDPARWEAAGTPDVGQADMTIAAHRGAAELAPENTLDAYRYAIAYGVDMIEIDVQQTLDGRYVSFHDQTVDAKTDGAGPIATMTYDQVRALNAADNGKWKGSIYDPAQIPSLEEILELAQSTNTGIYFDFKESVTHPIGAVDMAKQYDTFDNSAFLTYEPARAALIRAAHPTAPIMLSNPDPLMPAWMLWAIGQDYKWFGSSMPNYTPEKIAAIHDACGLVIPNVYQHDVMDEVMENATEGDEILYARSIGADGAQVNLPDVIADALDEPVPTKLEIAENKVCLLNSENGMGLPEKPLNVGDSTIETSRGGCVELPESYVDTGITFEGDGSALAVALSPSA